MRPVLLVTLGKTQLKLHPLLLVVLAGACVLGRLYALLQAMLALLLHEAAHWAAALAFGCRFHSMELQPFGAVARLDSRRIVPDAEWCIAAAGPAMSFIAAGVAALTCYISPRTGARIEPFLTFNLTLGVINLLPALPLDGGRIAKHLLKKSMTASNAHKATAWAGVVIGSVMLALCAAAAHYDIYNLTLPVMGVFLVIASVNELISTTDRQLATLWQKEDRLRSGGMDAHLVAAHASMAASEAIRLIRCNRYTFIRVIDERMQTVGELDETALIVGMIQRGSDARIGDILMKETKRGETDDDP